MALTFEGFVERAGVYADSDPNLIHRVGGFVERHSHASVHKRWNLALTTSLRDLGRVHALQITGEAPSTVVRCTFVPGSEPGVSLKLSAPRSSESPSPCVTEPMVDGHGQAGNNNPSGCECYVGDQRMQNKKGHC